jgi:hypothetical protein
MWFMVSLLFSRFAGMAGAASWNKSPRPVRWAKPFSLLIGYSQSMTLRRKHSSFCNAVVTRILVLNRTVFNCEESEKITKLNHNDDCTCLACVNCSRNDSSHSLL